MLPQHVSIKPLNGKNYSKLEIVAGLWGEPIFHMGNGWGPGPVWVGADVPWTYAQPKKKHASQT